MSLASISSSNHVLVYGSMTPAEKLTAAGKVGTAFGRAAWQALFKANPNIVSGHDIAVILTNSTTAALTFYFEVPAGTYNLSLGCLAPTSASAAGTVRLDGGEATQWSTAPGYAVYPQEIPILSGAALEAGLHNVVVVCQQPVALLGMRVVDASTNAIAAEVSAIQTFLYPNKKYIVPRTTTDAELIVPALNTRLYGPPLTTGPPSTGTPGPDLSCYEPEAPRTEPPYIILSGSASAEEKAKAISQIGTYCARTQWEKLLTDVPGIIGANDTVVILNAPTAALKFRFNAFKGTYNIIVRCVMPSANSDSGFVRLDSMPAQMFTRGFGPTKYATKQLNFLVYEKIYLDNGMHEVLFTAREPMGYIELIVNRPGANLPDIVIPATNVVTMVPAPPMEPNVVYSTTPPAAGYGTLETAYPTTTLPPPELTTTMAPVFTTTMAPTTTLMPVYTTTPPPETTTLMPTMAPTTTLMPTMAPTVIPVYTPPPETITLPPVYTTAEQPTTFGPMSSMLATEAPYTTAPRVEYTTVVPVVQSQMIATTTKTPLVGRAFFATRVMTQNIPSAAVVLFDSVRIRSTFLTLDSNTGIFTNTSGEDIKVLVSYTVVISDVGEGANCRSYIQTNAMCVPASARVGEVCVMVSYGTSDTILSGSFMIVMRPGGSFSIAAAQNSGKLVDVADSMVSGYVLPREQKAAIKASTSNKTVPSTLTTLTTALFQATPFNDQSAISYNSNGLFTNVSGGLQSYWVAFTGTWDANGTSQSNRRLYFQTDTLCLPSFGRIGEIMGGTANGSSDTVQNGFGLLQMKNNGAFYLAAQQDSRASCALSQPSYCAVMPVDQRILIRSSNKYQNISSSAMNIASIVAFDAITANSQNIFTYKNGSFINSSQAAVVAWVAYGINFSDNQTRSSNRRAFIKTDTLCVPLNTRVGEVLVGAWDNPQSIMVCGSAVINISPGGSFQVQVMQNSSATCVLSDNYCHILILE